MTGPLPGSAGGAPAWPPHLRDDTPLPFALWRVLHHVDGVRDVSEVARRAGVQPADVPAAVHQAANWAGRASQRGQPATPASVTAVTQALTAVLGPMARLLVDEGLDDLGDGAPLGALLSRIASQLSEAQVQAFVRQLRERGLA